MLFLNWLVFLTQTPRDHHPCSWTPGHKPLVPRGIWGISPCTAPCSAVVDRLSYSAGNDKSFQSRVGLNLVPVDSTWLIVFFFLLSFRHLHMSRWFEKKVGSRIPRPPRSPPPHPPPLHHRPRLYHPPLHSPLLVIPPPSPRRPILRLRNNRAVPDPQVSPRPEQVCTNHM